MENRKIPMKELANQLREVANQVTSLLQGIAHEDIVTRPAPKKWARKEILGHLIDSACNNHQKFVRMMQQEHLDFPGYRQDEWVELQDWAGADWTEMIDLWRSYNLHIAYLIETVRSDHLKNTISIDGVGPFTLEFIMPDYFEHLKHHVKQIFPDVNLKSEFENVYNA